MRGTNKVLGGGGFHHVAIKVHDFDTAVRFYTALGFGQKAMWGDGDGRFALMDAGDGNYMEIFAGGPQSVQHDIWGKGAALTHVALRTTDVTQAVHVAEAAGAKVTMLPKQIAIKGVGGKEVPARIAFVQSPTGEVIEFFDNDPALL